MVSRKWYQDLRIWYAQLLKYYGPLAQVRNSHGFGMSLVTRKGRKWEIPHCRTPAHYQDHSEANSSSEANSEAERRISHFRPAQLSR